MSAEFQYDVFLSHNQTDKPRVRRLAERMRAANLRVWFDEWVIQPGDDINLAIEHGLEASRTLACSAESSQRRRKRSTVGSRNLRFRDPANARRRFIPILLADCKCPNGALASSPRLAPRAYLGFAASDWNNPNGVVARGGRARTQPRWGCGFSSQSQVAGRLK